MCCVMYFKFFRVFQVREKKIIKILVYFEQDVFFFPFFPFFPFPTPTPTTTTTTINIAAIADNNVMRLQTVRILAAMAMAPSSSYALLNCDISVDGVKFDLTALGKSEHAISYSANTPPSLTNTTWYINPCATLSGSESESKLCPDGTQSEY